ncbi:PTS sugar transporter subunit IIB [Staphylococcus edaphicus]|uniref:PTS sugar transporter subunit IIB n=1 Tax=Staphylococcus edaphicus TaxID=1955013 RepID=A0A2C6WQD3_9STAP|nr:PTS sugar transporter subunit IIB [Staphylococcus edaphicus]PHK49946.1 PTS sugar transporter subunit IIB [Staphylococcus edaphicus]UQW81793.1 PTS sugar transporter subunit IIB [Staphylococcus edaphicus]
MSEKTIMLVCAAGMSTSMLVQKMQEAAEKQNLDREIFAVSTTEADQKIENDNIDILLLGPQVRFKKDEYTKKCLEKQIPVEVIEMRDYGTMNGERVLKTAEQLMTK